MELKFRKVDKAYKATFIESELAKGIKIKPFVTWDELSEIYKLVGAQENGFMKHYAKVVSFAKVCTNIDFEGMEDTEIYDICAELKLVDAFSTLMDEFYQVDKMVEKDESTYNLIKEITDGLLPQLNVAMEKLGDGSGFIEKIKGVMSGVNKKSD